MAFLGNMFGGKPNGTQQQSNNLLNYNAQAATPASQNAQKQGNTALGTGMNFLNQYSSTAGAPTNYFQSMLSGDRANTTSALAPDINRIQGETNNALQTTSTLNPRGGGRSSMLFNLPFQSSGQTSGLFNSIRPQAAQSLVPIAGQTAGIGLGEQAAGTNLLNTGANYLNSGTNAAGMLSQAGYQQHAQQTAAGAGAGSFLFNLLAGPDGGGLGQIINGIKGVPALLGIGGG